jgi:hypothetical protein
VALVGHKNGPGLVGASKSIWIQGPGLVVKSGSPPNRCPIPGRSSRHPALAPAAGFPTEAGELAHQFFQHALCGRSRRRHRIGGGLLRARPQEARPSDIEPDDLRRTDLDDGAGLNSGSLSLRPHLVVAIGQLLDDGAIDLGALPVDAEHSILRPFTPHVIGLHPAYAAEDVVLVDALEGFGRFDGALAAFGRDHHKDHRVAPDLTGGRTRGLSFTRSSLATRTDLVGGASA